ncbi:hypothetical protein PIB30_041398 [Stylosanthes scabra]|uniref:Uncharacterized protein n=1 Tax=Stylosanthes scabra TaxID=79078 RepID=A0ABU6SFR5_9FABA|nr:hypothetical protein [Stylosanthes scabra]
MVSKGTRCCGIFQAKGVRPFRFQAAWATHLEYRLVVQQRVLQMLWTIFGKFKWDPLNLILSTDPELFKGEALSFFRDLFCNTDTVDLRSLEGIHCLALSEEGRINLSKEVFFGEVESAVRSLNSFKAPGADGFQAFFYKEY